MLRLFCILLLSLCSPEASATESYNLITWRDYYVPLEVSTKQEICSVPVGWSLHKETVNNRLCGITIYDGNPADNISLVYDKELKKKTKCILEWSFNGSEKQEIWIVCHYSDTNIKIKKQLPAGIKMLRITRDNTIKLNGEPEIQKIEYN